MKKADMAGQVFLYILSGVIVSVILVFGIKAVFKLNDTSSDIKSLEFKQDFEQSIKLYMKYGSVYHTNVPIPGEYQKICFVDLDYDPNSKQTSYICSGSTKVPLICESWQANVKNNVFLIGKTMDPLSFRNNGNPIITVQGGSLCYPINNGRFEINGKGQGNSLMLIPN